MSSTTSSAQKTSESSSSSNNKNKNNNSNLLSSNVWVDQVFAEHVMTFIDRASSRQVMKVKPLVEHFRLEQYYCPSHGTKLNAVLDDDKNDDGMVVDQRAVGVEVEEKTAESNDDSTPRLDMGSEPPKKLVCEDCVQAKLGNVRCPRCDANGISHAFVPEVTIVECSRCSDFACRDCYYSSDGFNYCFRCQEYLCEKCSPEFHFCELCSEAAYCQTCDTTSFIFCAECEKNDGCEKCIGHASGDFCAHCDKYFCNDCGNYCSGCLDFTCRDCYYSSDRFNYCFRCKEYLCEKCSPDFHFCERCDAAYCQTCDTTSFIFCAECEKNDGCEKCIGHAPGDFCAHCEKYFCKDCVNSCLECYHIFCVECDPASCRVGGGGYVCESCLHCYKCEQKIPPSKAVQCSDCETVACLCLECSITNFSDCHTCKRDGKICDGCRKYFQLCACACEKEKFPLTNTSTKTDD